MSSTLDNAQKKIKILIGTPAYAGMCFIGYMSSFLAAQKQCQQAGIEIEPCFLGNESLIPRGRNTIVAKFMNDPSYTHLMFIDADISWGPQAITRLVAHNKDIIGALYPKKGYDWQKLVKNKDVLKILNKASEENRELTETEVGQVRSKVLSFVINVRNQQTKIEPNGLVSVLHIGTGFMLIKRGVIEKLMAAHPELKHDDDIGALNADENKWLYALFNCEIHKLEQSKKMHYLSEDYLFCKSWTDLGGEIFADLTISLTHTGSHSFAGNFAMTHNLIQPRLPVTQPTAVVPESKPAVETASPVKPEVKVERVPVTTDTPLSSMAIPISNISQAGNVAPPPVTAPVTKKKPLPPGEIKFA